MKNKIALLFILVFTLGLVQHVQAQEKKKFTNEQVLKMIKAELPESTIILAIEADSDDLDTSVDGLIALKEGGASKEILDAIAGAKNKKPEPAVTATPAYTPQAMPNIQAITVKDGDKLVSLKLAAGSMQASRNPFASGKLRQIFEGTKSPLRVSSKSPEIEFYLPSNYRAETTVVLLEPEVTSSERRIELKRAASWVTGKGTEGEKSLVPMKVEELPVDSMLGSSMKRYRMKPVNELAPGEYIVMQYGAQFYDFGVDAE